MPRLSLALLTALLVLPAGCKRNSSSSDRGGWLPFPTGDSAAKDTKPAEPLPDTKPLVKPTGVAFHRYRAGPSGFEAEFPWQKPVHMVRQRPSPWGQISETSIEVNAAPYSCSVSVASFNGVRLGEVGLSEVIDAGKGALAKFVGGRVESDVDVTVAGHAARDITIVSTDRRQGPVHVRYVPVGRRLYTMLILCDKGTVPEEVKHWFFASFKLI